MTTVSGFGDHTYCIWLHDHGSPAVRGVWFNMPDDIEDMRREVAEATRRALVAVALQAYEEAGLSGLCGDGRWEVALGAIRSYDLRNVAEKREL